MIMSVADSKAFIANARDAKNEEAKKTWMIKSKYV